MFYKSELQPCDPRLTLCILNITWSIKLQALKYFWSEFEIYSVRDTPLLLPGTWPPATVTNSKTQDGKYFRSREKIFQSTKVWLCYHSSLVWGLSWCTICCTVVHLPIFTVPNAPSSALSGSSSPSAASHWPSLTPRDQILDSDWSVLATSFGLRIIKEFWWVQVFWKSFRLWNIFLLSLWIPQLWPGHHIFVVVRLNSFHINWKYFGRIRTGLIHCG